MVAAGNSSRDEYYSSRDEYYYYMVAAGNSLALNQGIPEGSDSIPSRIPRGKRFIFEVFFPSNIKNLIYRKRRFYRGFDIVR
jgi:hypothetical protein